jgi:long-subunit fatty acid transport protein
VQIGLSYRPPVPVETTGTMEIELGKVPRELARIEGNQASFKLTLPQELKLGVQYKPTDRLLLTGEAVYQGWQSFSEWVLVPENITQTVNGGEPEKVAPIRIPKHWNYAWSGRFGAQYAFDFGLNVRAGVFYEQSGIPDEYANIDFLHFDRAFGTLGFDYTFSNVIVSTAFAWTPPQTKEITTSDVRQSNTDHTIPGAVIGNGTYTSGGWIFSLGLRGRFGA